jgi:ribosome modulation factor
MTTMAQPPKRPARKRPKLMTREEEAADATAAGAERQGAVAFHHGKARDACPFGEENLPLRQRWLAGHDKASA